MGGKAARVKGCAGERELVLLLRSWGLAARRVPLSGACEGFKDDVIVGPPEDEERWEVKRRGRAFIQIERWLDLSEVLAFRRDRGDWLVCLRLTDYLTDRGLVPLPTPPTPDEIDEAYHQT